MGDTCVPDGDVVDMTELIHPKVEAEIAFVMSRELSGDVSVDEVLAATEFVLPAIEVIDSRFKDFKFDIQSVIADNTSAARYVVGGSPRRPEGLDLRLLGVVMERNGELVGTAAGAAVMGHPAASVVALVRWLADAGQALPAGSLVMTGGVTEAVAVHAGDHVTATSATPRYRRSALQLEEVRQPGVGHPQRLEVAEERVVGQMHETDV